MSLIINGKVQVPQSLQLEALEFESGVVDVATTEHEFASRRFEEALSGDMVLVVVNANEDIEAAELNAAPAGVATRVVQVRLETAAGDVHTWANLPLLLTPFENVADVDVGVPVLIPVAPELVNGVATFQLEADTDANATKTYVAAEDFGVDIQVSATDELLGFTVAQVSKTFDVI